VRRKAQQKQNNKKEKGIEKEAAVLVFKYMGTCLKV
jgi:hypothetical protein